MPAASEKVVPDSALARLRTALTQAEWELAPQEAPRVLTTRPRVISSNLLGRTEVYLDLTPLGSRHARVLVHVTRHTILGTTSKQPYLTNGLRSDIFDPLTEALRAQGFTALDEPRERDEEATEVD